MLTLPKNRSRSSQGHYLYELKYLSQQCFMLSFVEIGQPVPEKKIKKIFMKGFYHIWAWWPSWSCDLDYLYIHWFPLPTDASCQIWL